MTLSLVQLTRKGNIDRSDRQFYPWKQVLPPNKWVSESGYFSKFVPWFLYKWTTDGKPWGVSRFKNNYALPAKEPIGKAFGNYHFTDQFYAELISKIGVANFEEFWNKAVKFQASIAYFENVFGFPTHYIYAKV